MFEIELKHHSVSKALTVVHLFPGQLVTVRMELHKLGVVPAQNASRAATAIIEMWIPAHDCQKHEPIWCT